VLNTTVTEDEILRQNPCRIKGYDRYHTPERPTATAAQVFTLADAMPSRFYALIVVAAFSSLRWGSWPNYAARMLTWRLASSGCRASSRSWSAA